MVCLYDSNHGKSTKGLEVIAAIKDAIMANCTDYIVEITEVHDIMHWQHDVFKPLILICPITNRLLHDTESALAKIRVEYYSSVALIVVHGKTKDYSRYGSSRSELSSKGNYGRLGEIIDWFMKNDSYNFEATRDIINFVTKMVK
ncbi:uncharacterized protein LOC128553855 [Mercenaria mercenaria]|uniref:uncharacterized protein LOC128553855 n=1 Tax=Mercenaria mercenaria TaxID=6596 RepID=UPI00234EEF06|nr:uncharacterized protein LOC128553855 [Mercenaria mercenaria]